MTSKRKRIRQYNAWCGQAREIAYDSARELALAIVVGGYRLAVPIYDLGIVPAVGEVVWQRTPAMYWWRGQQAWTEQHTSYNGRSATLAEVRRPVLNCAGTIDWLITNQRLAAREPTGEVISIHWAAIQAISIDLPHDAVMLDGADGYHGELRSLAIALIAVAAVASCYGPRALLDHPSLASLRSDVRGGRGTGRRMAAAGRTTRPTRNCEAPREPRPRFAPADEPGPAGHTGPVIPG